jgi:hypothetical protein
MFYLSKTAIFEIRHGKIGEKHSPGKERTKEIHKLKLIKSIVSPPGDLACAPNKRIVPG